MRKYRKPWNPRDFFSILSINLCVLAMFAAILTPQPDPVWAVADVTTINAQPMISNDTARAVPITGTAVRVMVPSVGIDATVREGDYDSINKKWSIDSDSAFHANNTVPVNNTNGTTLIYGHAERAIFSKLLNVQSGAEAYVDTLDGNRFVYSFDSNTQVEPSDTSMLISSGSPKLILQTCSGPFDAYRTMVTFSLQKVVRSE